MQGRHSLNINAQVTWISANTFIFPLAGYFLRHRARCFWNKRRLLVLWGINICMICLACYLTYFRSLITGVCDESNSQVFHNTFVLINAASIFSTLQYLCDRHVLKPKAEKLIISIGGGTFGVYLSHVFFMGYTKLPQYMEMYLLPKMQWVPMLFSFIYCGAVFLCGYAVTLIIKRIPVLKRLVS